MNIMEEIFEIRRSSEILISNV